MFKIKENTALKSNNIAVLKDRNGTVSTGH